MKFAVASLLLCIFCPADAAVNGEHPIERVINLIKGLKEDAIAEGKTEEVAYTKFEYWCSTSITELKGAIADEKEAIEELTDKLAGLNKAKEGLEADIKSLEDQLGELAASAKKAKDDRADTAALYEKASADLKSTVDAVGECIKALSSAEATTESMMLAQRHVKMVLSLLGVKATEHQRRVLEAYSKPAQLAEGDLAKHTDKYDFKSENVIELLKQLKLKFEDDLLAATKAETNSLNSYDLSKKARDNAIDAAEDSKKKKEKELADTNSAIADAEGEKKNQEDDLKADSDTLSSTEDACSTKKSEWETRSETRKLEIEAMDQAVKILAKSSGVRTEAPSNPIPPASPVSFLQIGSASDPKMKAVALLKEAAKAAHSRSLERLAVEVAAHLNGPFDQVNNMIQKMIFRLMDEQKQEDEHKHWCDQEIEKTEKMQDDKNDKIDELKAEIDVETGKVGELTSEIEAAEDMISKINGFVKEATEIRQTGKKENALALKDAQQAQTSLTNAIAVLQTFYKESGEIPKEPWEFIQKPVNLPKNPSTWDAGYTGVSDPKDKESGIISILESVMSDFAKMESDTKAQEAEDQKAYDEDMKEHAIEKAERTQEVKMKTAEKARRAEKIDSLSSTKKNVEGELEKTDQYMKDLQPACVDGDSSYEDRKAARNKEVVALKEAQATLQNAFEETGKTKFLQIKSHMQ